MNLFKKFSLSVFLILFLSVSLMADTVRPVIKSLVYAPVYAVTSYGGAGVEDSTGTYMKEARTDYWSTARTDLWSTTRDTEVPK